MARYSGYYNRGIKITRKQFAYSIDVVIKELSIHNNYQIEFNQNCILWEKIFSLE